MIRVAITGNIASGKSTVQELLKQKGYKILDTDEVSHKLLTTDNKELYDAFKNYDVFENGNFSRYKVGQLIFSNEDARLKIALIMHPQIAMEIEKFHQINSYEEYTFVSIPLLFEANMEYLFDKIIFVYTDDDIRLERLIKRNNYTVEYAKVRMNSQIPQEEKIQKCDFLINNNGTQEELKKKVFKLLNSSFVRQ